MPKRCSLNVQIVSLTDVCELKPVAAFESCGVTAETDLSGLQQPSLLLSLSHLSSAFYTLYFLTCLSIRAKSCFFVSFIYFTIYFSFFICLGRSEFLQNFFFNSHLAAPGCGWGLWHWGWNPNPIHLCSLVHILMLCGLCFPAGGPLVAYTCCCIWAWEVTAEIYWPRFFPTSLFFKFMQVVIFKSGNSQKQHHVWWTTTTPPPMKS